MQKMKHLCHFVYIDDSSEKKYQFYNFLFFKLKHWHFLLLLFFSGFFLMCENKRLKINEPLGSSVWCILIQ